MSTYVSHMHPYVTLSSMALHMHPYAIHMYSYEGHEYSYGSISTHPSIMSLRRGTQGVMGGWKSAFTPTQGSHCPVTLFSYGVSALLVTNTAITLEAID